MRIRYVAEKINHEGNGNAKIIDEIEEMITSVSMVDKQESPPPLPPPAATESGTGTSNE